MKFSATVIVAALSVAVQAAGPNAAMKEAFIEKYIELAKRQTNATVGATNASTSAGAGGAAAAPVSTAKPAGAAVPASTGAGSKAGIAAVAALIPVAALLL